MDFASLLSKTADGVCAVNGDGRIVLWNRAAERILGYSTREVTGERCCEVFAHRDGAGNRLCYSGCHVSAPLNRGELVRDFALATHTKAGKPVWLNISVLVVPGVRGELLTAVHLFRDVTGSRKTEALVRERLMHASASAANPTRPELTRRQLEILRLLAGGANTRTIAERLHVSPATVRNHVQNMLGKLGVHSRLEAAAYAMRHALFGT